MQQGINYAKVKDNATPCGVNLTRSHIVYWAARASIMYRMLINQSAAEASETILEEYYSLGVGEHTQLRSLVLYKFAE